jgi:hypothetical protein
MNRFQPQLLLAATGLALSVVSFCVVLQSASDEPYFEFRVTDAVVQVGGAMVLMLLWFQLAIALVFGVVRRRVSQRWLALVLWVFICEFYLLAGMSGYVQDIARFAST